MRLPLIVGVEKGVRTPFVRGSRLAGKRTNLRLPRILLYYKIRKMSQSEKINGVFIKANNDNYLDLRRSNLQILSPGRKLQQQKGCRASSGFRGVSCHQAGGYCAYIGFKNKRIYLGYFASAIKAAREYNKAALRYYGPSAYQNEITTTDFQATDNKET